MLDSLTLSNFCEMLISVNWQKKQRKDVCMSETPEQLKLRIDTAIKQIVVDLRALRPDAEIIVGKYVTEVAYYEVCVRGSKPVVERHTISLTFKNEAVKLAKRYLTKQEALDAISAVMPKAQAHFEKCLAAYNQLTKDMSFYIGFNYDGDTHGIYDEYEYISFEMDGFNFQFKLDKAND